MGFDKASMSIGGVSCARRVTKVLDNVASGSIEVGPGVSDLPSVDETPRGAGPLVALCAGAAALRRRSAVGRRSSSAATSPCSTRPF